MASPVGSWQSSLTSDGSVRFNNWKRSLNPYGWKWAQPHNLVSLSHIFLEIPVYTLKETWDRLSAVVLHEIKNEMHEKNPQTFEMHEKKTHKHLQKTQKRTKMPINRRLCCMIYSYNTTLNASLKCINFIYYIKPHEYFSKINNYLGELYA